MKNLTLLNFASLLALLLASGPSHAARPMVTDDARLTKSGSCQVESWWRANSDSNEVWALPACNPNGNFELTLGAAISKVDHQQTSSDTILQAKTIFKDLKTNSWGYGLGLGTASHSNDHYPGPNGVGSTYFYVPISHSFNDDQLIVHSNIGYIHYRHSSQDAVTWGIGAEYKVNPELLIIAETFGDHRNKPFAQAGIRYSLIPDILQIDTTVGHQLDDRHVDWLSIGVRYTPNKFFN